MKYVSFEKSVGGVIFRKEDGKIKFLLLRYRSWQWDFPKGHVERTETEEQTLRREIREETGIENIEILPKIRLSVRYFYTAKRNEKKERISEGKGIYIFKRAIFYAVKTDTLEIRIDFENKDFVWLSFEDALSRLGNDGSRKVLREVWKKIKS